MTALILYVAVVCTFLFLNSGT